MIHGETNGGTSTYWIAPNIVAPTFYFVFTTNNGQFIEHLNAAHVSGMRVRVQGSGDCGVIGDGTFRRGGPVLLVRRDSFS